MQKGPRKVHPPLRGAGCAIVNPIASLRRPAAVSFVYSEIRLSSSGTTVIEMPLFAGTAAEVRRGNATAVDGAQGSSSPRPPRPRSEASRILEGLCDIWDTWLPPKAVDSFRRGEWRGGGPRFAHSEEHTSGQGKGREGGSRPSSTFTPRGREVGSTE